MSVVDRPEPETVAFWQAQWRAAMYQQNVYASSIRQLETAISRLFDRIKELEDGKTRHDEKIGELMERMDKAAQVVKGMRAPAPKQQAENGGAK